MQCTEERVGGWSMMNSDAALVVSGNPERLHVCHAWVLMWPVRQGGTEYLTWFVVLRAIAMSRGTENI